MIRPPNRIRTGHTLPNKNIKLTCSLSSAHTINMAGATHQAIQFQRIHPCPPLNHIRRQKMADRYSAAVRASNSFRGTLALRSLQLETAIETYRAQVIEFDVTVDNPTEVAHCCDFDQCLKLPADRQLFHPGPVEVTLCSIIHYGKLRLAMRGCDGLALRDRGCRLG